jgi:hypothetical protein
MIANRRPEKIGTPRPGGKRQTKRVVGAGAVLEGGDKVLVQVDGEVDDLFTMERSTADVGSVFVSAETDPKAGGPAIVHLKSTGFHFTNDPKHHSIEFEADRESLYALGVALLRVANRVQRRHLSPRTRLT